MPLRLSVVVVTYAMARELPRTLRTLDPRHQRGIAADDYEVVVVDNGSPEPVDQALLDGFDGTIRLLRVDDAPPSPAHAANLGIEAAEAPLVGLIVDGARMSSPGLLAGAVEAATLHHRPVVTATAYHLGSVPHMRAIEVGHDQAAEDALLGSIDWELDGYELFSISTFAGSSWRGILGPMGESSSLFLPAALWRELGGLDERFDLPGGGFVNHDLYRRACTAPDTRLLQLIGEGTFHQFHGGAATSRRFGHDEMQAGYRALRGDRYRPPEVAPTFLGAVHPAVLGHLEASVRLARAGFRRPDAS
ncbi:MAG: glycosyltransferase [Actinobacteria bacterium]|nr:glycosyltransferase [Actinomycetota bacterium]